MSLSETRHGSYSPRDLEVALESLATSDGDEQSNAYWRIDNRVVVQGDLNADAAYVAEFLVDRLCRGTVGARALVYRLLAEIRAGSAPDDITVPTSRGLEPLKQHCSRVIAAALACCVNDAASSDALLRQEALNLIETLDDQRIEALELLTTRSASVTESGARKDILASISEIEEELYGQR